MRVEELTALRSAAANALPGVDLPPINADMMCKWSKIDAKQFFESAGRFLPPASNYKPLGSEFNLVPTSHVPIPASAASAPAAAASAAPEEVKRPPRVLMKPNGTPIPILPSGITKSVQHPMPTNCLFLHGFGDNPELMENFGLQGLKSCFRGCQVEALPGTIKLTTAEVEEHMIKGELRDLALDGLFDLYSWCPPDVNRSNGVEFGASLDSIEQKVLSVGGYEVICGFSDGGMMAYQLLRDRLERLQPVLERKVRLLLLCGMNDSPFKRMPKCSRDTYAGVKIFHCSGDQDGGFCNMCMDELKGPYLRCETCYDMDVCAACHALGPAGIAKLPKKDRDHTVDHPMQKKVPGIDMINTATLEQLAGCGIEVAHGQFKGGHKMPAEGDPVYQHVANFLAGKL